MTQPGIRPHLARRALALIGLATLTTTLAAQTPFPARVHQPDLRDPGIDGGGRAWFSRGDITPDGKLLVAYRRVIDPAYGGTPSNWGDAPWQTALTVSVTEPDLFNVNGDGHLQGVEDGFYDPLTSYAPYGQDFVFGDAGTGGWGTGDWHFVHWANALIPWTNTDPAWKKIAACSAPAFLQSDVMFDPDYPVGISDNGASMITTAFKETGHGNPYPSDASGAFDGTGTHTTYKIWIVRLHASQYYDEATQTNWWECNPNSEPGTYSKPLVRIQAAAPQSAGGILVCQDLTVVLDANDQIVSTDIAPYQVMTNDLGNTIKSLEPSMTSDGKLIIFNGSGSEGPGLGRVTYIYNESGCSPTGWSVQKNISSLPDVSEVEPALSANGFAGFKDRYKLFAQPIVLPPTGTEAEYVHQPGDGVRGPYPWLSRDGSFYIAGSTYSYESSIDPNSKRAGTYLAGSITGGYMKYMDDNGVNPSRAGAPWHWPPYATAGQWKDSWRSVIISSGLRPGPWDAFASGGEPMPDQPAGRQIPVLPLIFTISKVYGEARIEEADGNYLLYMGCNESLTLDPAVIAGTTTAGMVPHVIDPDSTPDTSGRAPRASCALNAGAAFPRDAWEVTHGAPGVAPVGQSGPELLRAAIGAAYGREALHENVGYRGQGIVFNATGHVAVSMQHDLFGAETLTAQCFVKLTDDLPETGELILLEHGGAFPVLDIKLTAQGEFVADLLLTTGSATGIATLTSRSAAIDESQLLTDPHVGWRHVAVTFDGDDDGSSVARLWVEGQLEDELRVSFTSTVFPAPGSPYALVGPGRGAADVVDADDILLVMDEVALSDVVRSEAELRRDAGTEPLPSPFGPWPSGAPNLPAGLDPDEARWPLAVAWNPEVVDLGEQLFGDTVLSPPGVGRSCQTCHDPGLSFTDGQTLPTAVGGGSLPPFNTPTLLNATFGTHKTFSGQAASLEDQIILPLENPAEMGSQLIGDVVARVAADPTLHANGKTYATWFADELGVLDEDTLAIALASYMRTLNLGGSGFSLLVQGIGPLAADEARGMALFFGKARCRSCHSGSAFTDDDFHNIRTVAAGAGLPDRASVTGRVIDAGALKTPGLRGIGDTAPYFHDGSRANLRGVVAHYNDPFASEPNPEGPSDIHLRPLDLTLLEQQDLVAFLKTL